MNSDLVKAVAAGAVTGLLSALGVSAADSTPEKNREVLEFVCERQEAIFDLADDLIALAPTDPDLSPEERRRHQLEADALIDLAEQDCDEAL